jgi:hypothetical protein
MSKNFVCVWNLKVMKSGEPGRRQPCLKIAPDIILMHTIGSHRSQAADSSKVKLALTMLFQILHEQLHGLLEHLG